MLAIFLKRGRKEVNPAGNSIKRRGKIDAECIKQNS
jgi:hypothetical protein